MTIWLGMCVMNRPQKTSQETTWSSKHNKTKNKKTRSSHYHLRLKVKCHKNGDVFPVKQMLWQAPGCTVIFLTGFSLNMQIPVGLDNHIQFVSDTYEC